MSKRKSASGKKRRTTVAASPKIQYNPARPLKLHLGCGYKILEGYVNIDLYSPAADLKLDITNLSTFHDNSVDEIYLNAVFEHLYIFEQRKALAEWHRVLKPGGVIRIDSIPDFDEIVRAYIERAPGNSGGVFDIEEVSRYTHGAYSEHNKLGQIHKDVFNKEKVRKLLEDAGFEVCKIESVCWGDEPNPVSMNVTAVKPKVKIEKHTDDTLFDPIHNLPPVAPLREFAAVYCVHDDTAWLAESVESIYNCCGAIYFLVSDRPWNGEPADSSGTVEFIRSIPDPENKLRVVKGTWDTEAEQRNAGLDILKNEGYDYCLIIDADEVYDPTDLNRMMRLVKKHPEIDCWHVVMDTYWKSWRYRIDPREPLKPVVFIKVGAVRFTANRNVGNCARGLIAPEVGYCHHLSYARNDEQILRKIATFSHADEIREGWFQNVWKRWDSDHSLANLHPTHPPAYRRAIEQPYWALPPVLRKKQIAEHTSKETTYSEPRLPITSIIILTRNQLDYTKRCVESIERWTLEPYEIIIVDNGSTDGTLEYLDELAARNSLVRVVKNGENLGFAAGNNRGIAVAKGDYVLLMNNDVVVTPGWLERMLACAARDPQIGIVGPTSNCVSGLQYVDQPLYNTESLTGLERFSQEWAFKHHREVLPIWRIVGFCMLISRAVIEKIGGLDERFGQGNFEDDDFCIRAAIAGWKCAVARDSFVHHFGSRTFASEKVDYSSLLAKNWEIYKQKWGLPAELRYGAPYSLVDILKQPFDPKIHRCEIVLEPNNPKQEKKEVSIAGDTQITESKLTARQIRQDSNIMSRPDSQEVAKPKRLSLCMIARDEERFLEDCLSSVKGLVDEIVVLDTGSKDRTVEIARSHGATVHSFTWNESYSDARNEALKYVTGDWVLFLDADERLDPSGKQLIVDAISKDDIEAYELLFYNYCREGSSAPDIVHRVCRLVRNRPTYRFEGRIHENIIPSIVAAGGRIEQLDAIVHHYGYKPDVTKQRNKHERYLKLLLAELQDRPNDLYVLHHISAAHCAQEEFEQAIPYLEQMTELLPPGHAFSGNTYSRLINAYWATGHYEKALETAKRAKYAGVEHPEINFSTGNALLALGRYEEAARMFESAIELGKRGGWLGDPGTYGFKAKFGIARAYIGLSDFYRAIQLCKEVIAEQPNHAHAHEVLALAYTRLEMLSEAESEWLEVLRLIPGHIEALSHIARIEESSGRFVEAAEHYKALIEANPESAELHFRTAICLESANDIDQAERYYLQAIELTPDYVDAINNLGHLYKSQGRFQEALDCFARIVEVDPNYANAYFGAGDVLYAAGRYQEAADVYQNGLAIEPTRATGFLVLGNCCFRIGAMDAAAIAYRQALSLDPNCHEARNNLSLIEDELQSQAA
jgi:GT2 family glycosyltransferase/tetratricopeptide (TPR) repeat protein/predicted SAM-dependent methyltransferase